MCTLTTVDMLGGMMHVHMTFGTTVGLSLDNAALPQS
jgi:hypothetical protein